ncbi:urease accessory protein UreJ [Duganella sp. Leaf126]|uniref:HupE/UreJ family protein n=1 Tax=Duganella sp. Leaf126 TaxID=1736266 RepID=UPI0006FF42A9|nr:HupE/UreJ family protein [Duganella sp. Leaf126]KQQ45100.1 urease accessory protein UreJ [Duganella sp. Leaf126]
MKFNRKLVSVLVLALAASGSAMAHPGHAEGAVAGLLHPLTGLDHILAMVAVGLWAAQLGGRAQWLLPASFVGFLAVGGVLGASGAVLPMAETGIVTSVLLLGMLIGFAVKLPAAPAALAVGVFALCHGYAHGVEMPVMGSGLLYGLGFVAASAALHAAGLGLARTVQARGSWLRAAGAAIALAGVWLGVAA